MLKCRSNALILFRDGKYSGLSLNQYGVASPCSDLNLTRYNFKNSTAVERQRPSENCFPNGKFGFQTA